MAEEKEENRTFVNGVNLQRHLTSIEYPGLVNDHEKAIKSMGGIWALSLAHSQGNRKIELRFRPDDPFCKPAHGERIQTSNLLFKVVKKTRRNKKTNETSTSYYVTVEGVIGTTYRFTTLCDFQYLPMEKNPDFQENTDKDQYISIIEKVVPQSLVSLDWIKDPCPIFMSPPLFSRMDVPVEYNFRSEAGMAAASNKNTNVIGRLRKRRSLQAIFLNFEDEYVPERPRDLAIHNLAVRFIKQEDVDQVKKLFEERPVWTKAALAFFIPGVEHTSLKYILTASAYYFTTGPWRNAWVRIGYDPRKDPSARKYQILDYRILQTLKSKVTPKRSYTSYTQPHKYGSSQRKLSSIRQQQESVILEPSVRTEESFTFRPGFIPKCRQMFYQLCDLHVPEIEEMLEITPPNETCDERHGWFPPSVEDDCRRILSKHILEAFGQKKSRKKSDRRKRKEDEDEEEDDEEEDEDDYVEEDDEENEEGAEETNLNESLDESSTSDEEYKPGMD